MRQQQQPDNAHQVDFVPSTEAENILPSAHPSRMAHVRKDNDSERLEARRRQLDGNLVALSSLLCAPGPAEHLMSKALDVSAHLLPQDWKLRLFECKDSGFTCHKIVSSRDHQVGEREESQTTLGFGESIDQQVMHAHRAFRTEHLLILPLRDATEALVGVLVAMRASQKVGSSIAADDALLTVIGTHMTVLLTRAAAERVDVSSLLAMQAAESLALPSIGQIAMQMTGANDGGAVSGILAAAQEYLLTNAVRALDEIIEVAGYARSATALALIRTWSDEWKPLRRDASQREAGFVLSSNMLSSILHRSVRGERDGVDPIEIRAESHPGIWAALAPLRAYIAEHTGSVVARLTLLPITDSEQQVIALLCLTWHTDVNTGMTHLLTLISGIGVAVNAGLRTIGFAEQAQAEGHARDAFISLSAHELRSPLTSIKGYAQLLLRQSKKTDIPESMLHSVESIEQQSVRMAEMVGELLDASRIRRGVLEVQASPVDMVPLVRRVAERRAALFPQHTITCDIDEEPIFALADVPRVEQVLRALIDNGARHMPKGGIVTVTLSRQHSMALFTVQDQGVGIPEGERERIFEYLYRSSLSEKKNLSGLGLGLYISRHIVERLGGRLWLETSRTGEPTGSKFCFTVPLVVAPSGCMQDERRS